MRNRAKLVGVSLFVGLGFGLNYYLYAEEWKRCCSGIADGMTLDQVRQVIGRHEDEPDRNETAAREFERSWTFEDSGIRITVVFDRNGRSTYKEIAPDYCGNTPLMEKYRSD